MQAMPRPESDIADLGERVRALAPMLADPDPRVRKSAVIALGRMACPEATRALCDRLLDPIEGVRVLACQALGRLADPASVPALLARVHDDSAEVRAGVLWALANVVAHGDLGADGRQALFSPIVVMAFDPDDGVRADAAAVLGALRDPRATDALAVLLEDACPRVRANACASLGLLDDEPGFDVLLAVAQSFLEDPLVLVSALDGLARRAERGGAGCDRVRMEKALASACALARMPEDTGTAPAEGTAVADVRSTALWALGFLASCMPDCPAAVLDVLADALGGGDVWARRYAIEALACIHTADARTVLETWAGAVRTPGDRAEAPELDNETERVLQQALQTFEG